MAKILSVTEKFNPGMPVAALNTKLIPHKADLRAEQSAALEVFLRQGGKIEVNGAVSMVASAPMVRNPPSKRLR